MCPLVILQGAHVVICKAKDREGFDGEGQAVEASLVSSQVSLLPPMAVMPPKLPKTSPRQREGP